MTKQLYKRKKKKEINELVNVNNSGLIDSKDEIKKMSEDEIETEKPDKLLEIVEEILTFNRENRKQQSLGLKILTPNQILSRLLITLAQLKAVKMKLDNYYILCTDQKNLRSNSIKV